MATIVFETQLNEYQNRLSPKDNLSVLVGANRFFFYVSDAQKRILYQKHFLLDELKSHTEIRSIVESESILKHHFQQINVGVDSEHFSLVPALIYRPSVQKSYLEAICQPTKQEMIFTDAIEELDIKNVHTIDSRLYDELQAVFPTFNLYHIATPFLRRTKRLINGDDIIVNVQPSELNIIVYKNNQFQLYNNYKYNSAEAFLYYVLLMYQQFDLDVNTATLTLMGGIMPNSMIYKLLSTYIRQIQFAKRTKYYQFSPEYSSIPQQFHFDLYSLSVCE